MQHNYFLSQVKSLWAGSSAKQYICYLHPSLTGNRQPCLENSHKDLESIVDRKKCQYNEARNSKMYWNIKFKITEYELHLANI
jgi:hypothetical protein